MTARRPRHTAPEPGEMWDAIGGAERLVARAHAAATALADFGVDLPPPSAATADSAQLRAIAGLYLAAELDAAGLIAAAEVLAGMSGAGVPFALGGAAAAVEQFWQERHTRATAAERGALFSRLFGTDTGTAAADHPGNAEFETDMIELAESLYKLDESATNAQWGGVPQQARVRTAASHVVDGLTGAASGLTVFMAQDLIATIKAAFAIFHHVDLRLALGVHDVWGAVAAALRSGRLPETHTALHASRAAAGMTILSWVADAAPHLGEGAGPLVMLDHPVIPAAIDWLQLSLKLGEASTAVASATPVQTPASMPAPAASPWAALSA